MATKKSTAKAAEARKAAAAAKKAAAAEQRVAKKAAAAAKANAKKAAAAAKKAKANAKKEAAAAKRAAKKAAAKKNVVKKASAKKAAAKKNVVKKASAKKAAAKKNVAKKAGAKKAAAKNATAKAKRGRKPGQISPPRIDKSARVARIKRWTRLSRNEHVESRVEELARVKAQHQTVVDDVDYSIATLSEMKQKGLVNGHGYPGLKAYPEGDRAVFEKDFHHKGGIIKVKRHGPASGGTFSATFAAAGAEPVTVELPAGVDSFPAAAKAVRKALHVPGKRGRPKGPSGDLVYERFQMALANAPKIKSAGAKKRGRPRKNPAESVVDQYLEAPPPAPKSADFRELDDFLELGITRLPRKKPR